GALPSASFATSAAAFLAKPRSPSARSACRKRRPVALPLQTPPGASRPALNDSLVLGAGIRAGRRPVIARPLLASGHLDAEDLAVRESGGPSGRKPQSQRLPHRDVTGSPQERPIRLAEGERIPAAQHR